MAEQFTVEVAQSGERLDRFLLRAVPGATAKQIQDWIAQGAIRIRGKVPKPLRRLHRGDVVELTRPTPRSAVLGPAAASIPVLFRGAGVLVVDKPAGLEVDHAGPHRSSVVSTLAQQEPGWDVAGEAAPGVVHRLDKDTSGCLLLARNDAAVAALHAAFDAGTIEKTYLVAVLGEAPPEGKLDTSYARDPKDPRRFTSKVRSPRRARLAFRTLRVREGCSVLEVRLETGRTHQIRVQLADAGLPVLGDALYGPRAVREHPASPGRQALHAHRLAFPDPVTGERIEVTAPIPDDLGRVLERLHP